MDRFLDIDYVTAMASTIIKGATTEDRVLFKSWVYLGMREIGPSKDNVKVASVLCQDFSIRKPDDYIEGIDIGLFNALGQEMRYRYRPGSERVHNVKYVRNLELPTAGDVTGAIDLSEDDYYFHVSSNATGVSYAKLRYFSFPIDSKGQPKVPEGQLNAIMHFIRYMWAMSQDDNQSKIENSYMVWQRELSKAKTRNKMPSMIEGKEIAKTWMSMIQKPFFDSY
jgi:hypothetical protein